MGSPPIDRRLVSAIRLLAAQGLSYAEIRRTLGPLANRLGVARPAYTTVRRIAIIERCAADAKTAAVEAVLAKILQGRLPTPYELEQVQEAVDYRGLVRALAL